MGWLGRALYTGACGFCSFEICWRAADDASDFDSPVAPLGTDGLLFYFADVFGSTFDMEFEIVARSYLLFSLRLFLRLSRLLKGNGSVRRLTAWLTCLAFISFISFMSFVWLELEGYSTIDDRTFFTEFEVYGLYLPPFLRFVNLLVLFSVQANCLTLSPLSTPFLQKPAPPVPLLTQNYCSNFRLLRALSNTGDSFEELLPRSAWLLSTVFSLSLAFDVCALSAISTSAWCYSCSSRRDVV